MREFRGNPRSNYFPRDGLRSTGVQILDEAGNLLIPCCLGSFVDSGVEALDERASPFGAFFFGKADGRLKQLGSLLHHYQVCPRILYRTAPRSVSATESQERQSFPCI